MTEAIKIVEVGPRDGLQNESRNVDVDTKVLLVERLVDAGLRHIEAASFVSPKWVPQMAGSAEVMHRLPRRHDLHFSALTPNRKGLDAAIDAGCREVAVFGAASQAFSQKNINCSIEESLDRFEEVTGAAVAAGIRVRGYVSCVLGCPYEGEVSPEQVVNVAHRLLDMGCHEISLGDTIGRGPPDATRRLPDACLRRIPATQLAGHFHDTYGMAIANVAASLEMGLRIFDSSVAGLGGCPYAAGASGNVATGDGVFLMHGMGYETGVDLVKLVEVGDFISRTLDRTNMSRAGRALLPGSASPSCRS